MQGNLIETLRFEVQRDPLMNSVMHVCALRRRNRDKLSLEALYNKMKDEGFNYSRHQYEPILKTLAQLGLGKLEMNKKGKVIALKEIESTVQALGKAACGDNGVVLKALAVKSKVVTTAASPSRPQSKHALTLSYRSGAVSLILGSELSDQEVCQLVCKFRAGGVQ